MIKVAVVGLGKMGLSHLSMINAHPEVQVVGICDATGYMLDILTKYTGLPTFKDLTRMLDEAQPDALIVATGAEARRLAAPGQHGEIVVRTFADAAAL